MNCDCCHKTPGQRRGRLVPAGQARALRLLSQYSLARFSPCPLAAAILLLPGLALALDGQVQIHDPSTLVRCDGKYYTFGTGGTTLVSEDGWTWARGVRPAGADWLPTSSRWATGITYVARNIGATRRHQMIWSKTWTEFTRL